MKKSAKNGNFVLRVIKAGNRINKEEQECFLKFSAEILEII